MALANQIEDLAISEVPYYVEAQIASLRSPAFPPQTGRSETGGLNWGATADSPWPLGTHVSMSYRIPLERFPKLDATREEKKRKNEEFERLLEKVTRTR